MGTKMHRVGHNSGFTWETVVSVGFYFWIALFVDRTRAVGGLEDGGGEEG